MRFLDLDNDEAFGLLDDPPAPSALRLMPRTDYPQAVGVVDLILLGPGHLNDRGAVGNPTLAAARAKGVHPVFGHAVSARSRGSTSLIVEPPPCGARHGLERAGEVLASWARTA